MNSNSRNKLFSIKLKDLRILPKYTLAHKHDIIKIKFKKADLSYVFLDRPYRRAKYFKLNSLIRAKNWDRLSAENGKVTSSLLLNDQIFTGEMSKPKINKSTGQTHFKIKTYTPILKDFFNTHIRSEGDLFFFSSPTDNSETFPDKPKYSSNDEAMFFLNDIAGRYVYRPNIAAGFLTINPQAKAYTLINSTQPYNYPFDVEILTNRNKWSEIFNMDNPNVAFVTSESTHILTIDRPKITKNNNIRFKFSTIDESNPRMKFNFTNSKLFIDSGSSGNQVIPMAEDLAFKTLNYYQAAHMINKYIIRKILGKFWTSASDSDSNITSATINYYYEEYDGFDVPINTTITDSLGMNEGSDLSDLVESQTEFISQGLTNQINEVSSSFNIDIDTSDISSLAAEQTTETSQYITDNSFEDWTVNRFESYIGQTAKDFLADQWSPLTNSFSQSKAFSAVDESWQTLSNSAKDSPDDFGLDTSNLLETTISDEGGPLFEQQLVNSIADTGYTSFGALETTESLTTTTDALVEFAGIATEAATDELLTDFLFIGLACFGL